MINIGDNEYLNAATIHYVAPIASGKCGDNLTWTLNGDGVFTVSGSGAMYDYYDPQPILPWSDYREQIKTAILESGVTSVGANIFRTCRNLESVTIPDSVTSIGYSAFYECNALKSITIPNNVTSIGELAFYDCDTLKSVIIPNKVESVGNGAFLS